MSRSARTLAPHSLAGTSAALPAPVARRAHRQEGVPPVCGAPSLLLNTLTSEASSISVGAGDSASASGECSLTNQGGRSPDSAAGDSLAPEAFWRGNARPPQVPADHGHASTSGRFGHLPRGIRTSSSSSGSSSSSKASSSKASSSSSIGSGRAGVKTRTAPAGADRATPQSAPDPAALTAWIKSCRDVARLERLVRQHGERMNHIHVSAAITHLSQLAAADPAVSEALEAAAAAAAAAAEPSSQLQAPPGPAAGPALGASSAGSSAGSRAAELAGTLSQSLLRLLRSRLADCEPRQLANTAWALGKWPAGLRGRREALLDVARAAESQMSRFRPQELCNLLHGCASVIAAGGACGAVLPPPPGVSVTVSPAATAAGGGEAAAAGGLPASFLKVHAYACAAVLTQRRPPASEAGSGAGHGGARPSFSSNNTRNNNHSFKMQELSNLLWSWGALLGSDSHDALSPDASGSRSAMIRPSTRRPAVGSSAMQEAVPPHTLPYLEVLSAQMALGLEAAGPQELANSVHGLARLQVGLLGEGLLGVLGMGAARVWDLGTVYMQALEEHRGRG